MLYNRDQSLKILNFDPSQTAHKEYVIVLSYVVNHILSHKHSHNMSIHIRYIYYQQMLQFLYQVTTNGWDNIDYLFKAMDL